ncbi:LysE family transporter [Candidatus Woesearchaeota archaeon]|nr:LysE family transporter [Candidatus Woesearchaeota archaeon]
MVFFESLLLGITFSLSSVGPVTVEILRRSLKEGYLSALGIILGATIVDFIYLVVIFSGLYNFFNITAANKFLTFFGILFMLYLGYKSIADYKNINLEKKQPAAVKNSFLAGIFLGFSSPFAFVFYLGVFAPLVTSAEKISSGLIIALTIILGIFLADNLKAIVGHFGRKVATEKIISYTSLVGGISLILFAIYFGYRLILQL